MANLEINNASAQTILERSKSKLKEKFSTKTNEADLPVGRPGGFDMDSNDIDLRAEDAPRLKLETLRHEALHAANMNKFLNGHEVSLRSRFLFPSKEAFEEFLGLGSSVEQDHERFKVLIDTYSQCVSSEEVRAYLVTGLSSYNAARLGADRDLRERGILEACDSLPQCLLMLEAQREVLNGLLEGNCEDVSSELVSVPIDRSIFPNAQDGLDSYTKVYLDFKIGISEPITYIYTTLTDISEEARIIEKELPEHQSNHLAKLNKMEPIAVRLRLKATELASIIFAEE